MCLYKYYTPYADFCFAAAALTTAQAIYPTIAKVENKKILLFPFLFKNNNCDLADLMMNG